MPADDIYPIDQRVATESTGSAISWPAIFGGGIAAAATTLLLLLIGSGFGLAMTSPWPNAGATATTFTIAAGIWLIVMQWISSGLGGFITGRLRTKWVRVHTHEVFFRDTAHGLLTWSLATVIGAILVASAGSAAIGTGTRAAATVAQGGLQGAAQGATQTGLQGGMQRGYDVDSLFRGEKPELASSDSDVRGETTRILGSGLANGGDVPAADRTYLAGMIAQRTGIPDADARKRVDDVIAREKEAVVKARQVADTARKSTAAFTLFTALSMLIGAFIASAAAAYGGSLRDEHP